MAAVLEIENRGRRGAVAIPGMLGVPFAAIDAVGVEARHAAHRVEAVDRHVEQQHVIHLLAKAAEMRREEEVGVHAGDVADRAGAEKAGDAPDAGEIAAVLHDRVQLAGGSRAGDEIARLVHRLRHRLFAEDMAAGARGPPRTTAWRAAGTTTSNSRSGWVSASSALEIVLAISDRVGSPNSAARALGAGGIEIGEADDFEIVDLGRGLQPSPAHIAAADQQPLASRMRVSPCYRRERCLRDRRRKRLRIVRGWRYALSSRRADA